MVRLPDYSDGMEPGRPEATPGEDALVVLIIRTAKALVEELRSARATEPASATTVIHGLAVHYIRKHEGVTTSDLARYLKVTKQSASEIVGVLEHEGVVQRAPHPTDRRARVLLLTDEGRARLHDGSKRWQEIEREWATLVGRDRLDVVRDVLETYLSAVEDDALISH
jgi:DNA-binding MarR family transcriptional regulator